MTEKARGSRLPAIMLLVVFVAMISVFGYYQLKGDPTLLESQLLNDPVPAFTLPTLDDPGKSFSAAALKGKVHLLNIWATWCPSCYAEHPMLLKLAKEQGISIIGVNYKDEREKALRYLAEQGNPYETVISDERGRLGIDLGVYGAPETFLVDADGIIRFRLVGVVDERTWSEQLAPRIAALNGSGR